MKRKLITSALPYVNNIPHLGNLLQVLSADVFARFCRLKGYKTLYICGTDEYGTATETKALQEGKTPQQLCDYYHAIHSDIYNWFNIAFDYFGRTSTPQQTEITQQIFLDLEKNGFITEHEMQQLYCPQCRRFLADRYVRGTCPHCSYEDARGDQCEQCGKLLDPTELKNPQCATCGGTPEPQTTKHLYINLLAIISQYQPWMEEASKNGEWSNNALQMTKSWIRDGLQERAITRDLQWGIPVPKAGYEKKVFYVWFDAPIGYISITKSFTDITGGDWKSWWLDQKDVELFQFIGKDNIPFHTVIFPCSLIGSGQNWTKLFHMSSTEYLNYESGKFSKSKGVGVFGSDAKESGIPADMWRFYLFYNRPEKNDTQFTWKDFQERVNSELIGNFCNLVNRTFSFISRYYNGCIPEVDGTQSSRADVAEPIKQLRKAVESYKKSITDLMDWANLRDGFHQIFELSSIANKAFQDGEPWKNRDADPEKTEALLSELCYFIKDLLILIHPFMPEYASQAASFLGIKIWSGNVFNEQKPDYTIPKSALSWSNIGERKGLKTVQNVVIIYKTLDDKTINAYRERYAGNQQERKKSKEPAAPAKETLPADAIFSQKIALKTAKVIRVERHPEADKLYIETLDDGSGEERVILSGLVPYMEAEEILGKTIIIADNLKPRKMRGIESRGMLLAADYFEGETRKVELLEAPWAAPGTPVLLEGEIENANAEAVAEHYQKRPHSIDADVFFSVPIQVTDYSVTIAGKKLTVDGKPITTAKTQNGTVG